MNMRDDISMPDKLHPDNRAPEDRVWERGFEDHELQQMRRLAKLPFAEKLKWLEEAHRMVLHMQKGRESRSKPNDPGA